MLIARAHDPKFVRVVAAGVLHAEAVPVGLANIAAVDPGHALHATQQIGENLEIGELVVGRKARMRLRRTFELR